MIKETVMSLKVGKITDVYALDEIENFFDIRHITYQIRDGVTICDENGEALVNQETGERIAVKRLIVFEIPNIQIILDAAKNEETGEDVYHVVIVSDVDDKLYPVTLDTVYDVVMKTHNDRLMPYYLMDVKLAVPSDEGWYMCICENGAVKNCFYGYQYTSKKREWIEGYWSERPHSEFEVTDLISPVAYWLIPGQAIKMADTIANNDRLFLRSGIEDEYVKVSRDAYERLKYYMFGYSEGDDQNDTE